MTSREAKSRRTREATVAAARDLRKLQTPSEAALWEALRNRKLLGRKFRRQARIGHYVVDFYCASERLVVEVDSGIHRSQRAEDRDRQDALQQVGLRVLRVSAEACEQDLSQALNQISASFTPVPSPSHEGEGWPKAGVREQKPS